MKEVVFNEMNLQVYGAGEREIRAAYLRVSYTRCSLVCFLGNTHVTNWDSECSVAIC